jgi:hypothetical protein
VAPSRNLSQGTEEKMEISQDIRCRRGRDSNWEPSEYISKALPLEPICSAPRHENVWTSRGTAPYIHNTERVEWPASRYGRFIV